MDDNQNLSTELQQPGSNQVAVINNAKQKAAEELIGVIGGSHDVLVRVRTVFPLTLFPDAITIDRTKLTITHREFFKVGESLSLNIEDILNVTAGVGPFFGTIKLSSRFFHSDQPYIVEHLWRNDALKIKRILQGYIIAKQKEVDCSALSTKELTLLLDELGKVGPAERV